MNTTTPLQNAIRMILYMEALPPEQFDITNWVTRLHGRAISSSSRNHECGTVCCFVGHLPLAFPDHFHHHQNEESIVVKQCEGPLEPFTPPLRPIADFFGISFADLINTVMASGYEEKHEVTKDIVLGRFMDKIQKTHGVNLESLLNETKEARADLMGAIAESKELQQQYKDAKDNIQ